jgi:CubicO group peptidase (beta-lactamase class C family)
MTAVVRFLVTLAEDLGMRGLVFSVAASMLVTGSTNSATGQGPRAATPAQISAAVDSFAKRVISEKVAPAFGVAIVMDGRTVFAKSYGLIDATNNIPADDRTLWYVASTSKSYTGFGVTLLAHQGVISFDTPIGTLLPGVEWPRGADPKALTLARFLAHTHYINDNAVVMSAAFTGAIPEAQWPSLIKYATVRRDQDLTYSNFGYNVAAMVIDAKRPEGWKRYLDSAVYKPAGMNETYARTSGLERRIATTHGIDKNGAWVSSPFEKRDPTMNSAGGHIATLGDLARWVTVHMDGGMLDGKRVFPAEAIALSHKLIAPETRDQAKRFGPFDREGWSAGWNIGSYLGEPMVSRFGSYSSTRSHISFLPRRRMGMVAQTNGPMASSATDLVAALAYDLEAGRPDAFAKAEQSLMNVARRRAQYIADVTQNDESRAARQKPTKNPIQDFVGSYEREGYGVMSFELRGNTLWYKWGVLSGPAEVYDANSNVLRIETPASGGTTVPFKFPRNGPAEEMEFRGDTWKRVARR